MSITLLSNSASSRDFLLIWTGFEASTFNLLISSLFVSFAENLFYAFEKSSEIKFKILLLQRISDFHQKFGESKNAVSQKMRLQGSKNSNSVRGLILQY